MSALRMCDLGHVSRAGLYRFEPKAEKQDDVRIPGHVNRGFRSHVNRDSGTM